jgi:hypothetical protein
VTPGEGRGQRSLTHGPVLEMLITAVRPEVRADVLVPDPEDPVLGRRTCPVPGCDRSRAEYGMCTAHGNRWRDRAGPAWLSSPPIPARR